jgi:hypothetical protein
MSLVSSDLQTQKHNGRTLARFTQKTLSESNQQQAERWLHSLYECRPKLLINLIKFINIINSFNWFNSFNPMLAASPRCDL